MIIDTHIHFGYIAGYKNYAASLSELLSSMDKLGIGKAINSSTRGLMLGDFMGEAVECVELYRESGGRIVSYLTYNPRHYEACDSVIANNYDGLIFRGIKLHPSFHNVPGDDKQYENIWRLAADKEIVIMAHSWDISLTNPTQEYSYPTRYEKFLRKFPEVKFIFAHAGGRYNAVLEVIRIAKEFPNVYLDIAGDLHSNGFIEHIVNELGSRRILFGSDYSMMDQRNMLGVVLGADINIVDKENILHNNACALFELNGGCTHGY